MLRRLAMSRSPAASIIRFTCERPCRRLQRHPSSTEELVGRRARERRERASIPACVALERAARPPAALSGRRVLELPVRPQTYSRLKFCSLAFLDPLRRWICGAGKKAFCCSAGHVAVSEVLRYKTACCVLRWHDPMKRRHATLVASRRIFGRY